MKSSAYYRPCEVTMPNVLQPIPALFHRWDRVTSLQMMVPEEVAPESYRETQVVGIVETVEGNVYRVAPKVIRFTGGLARRLVNKYTEAGDTE